MSRLEQILESAEDEQLTAVMFVDLDRFKSINDRFGHHIGDEFLAATSARIQGQLREGSAVGRLGGDEFLIVMPGVESEEAAVAAAERVADSLREPIRLGIGAQPAQASIGLAVQRGPAGTAESLVNHADTAMYAAKAVGAGGVVAA
jgi:diguanylate cyclase (GGDEF)-like protein